MSKHYVVLLLTLALFVGCESQTPITEESSDTGGESSSSNSEESDVRVETKSWDEVQAWIAEQRGKVVVVDLWSTYCGPCKREFPHFVSFHEGNDEHVVCASLSLDYYGGNSEAAESLPEVKEFLASQKATMENFLSTTPDSDVLGAVNASAVPVALVYDQAGELHKMFSNDNDEYGEEGFTYEEHIAPLVKKLVGGAVDDQETR